MYCIYFKLFLFIFKPLTDNGMFQWRLKEVLTKFAGLYTSDHFWHCLATWNCVTYLFQYVIILKISIFLKKIWCYLRANNGNKGKIWRARVSKFRSETKRVWTPVTIVTVVVYILNSKDVQGVTLTMDRKYWLFGGITAAVISGAYVFWTSSSKSNKKKGKILGWKISYQYSNYFISSIYNMENWCFTHTVIIKSFKKS